MCLQYPLSVDKGKAVASTSVLYLVSRKRRQPSRQMNTTTLFQVLASPFIGAFLFTTI